MGDLIAWGMTREQAMAQARIVAGPEAQAQTLPAALRDAIEIARAAAGQWRMAGGGMAPMRPVAWDWTAIDTIARWLGLAPSRALMSDLRILEDEALRIFREREAR